MNPEFTRRLAALPGIELPEPQDSALGIVLRSSAAGGYEVLFGRRAARARFMPGHLAFPGGRLEEADRPGEKGAFARCASRELHEETGLEIPPDAWIDIDERVTPPFFHIRFRTRFFVALLPDGQSVPDEPPAPGEIDQIRFARPEQVLEEWRRGKSLVPPPCLPVLRQIRDGAALDLSDLAAALRETNLAEQTLPRIEFGPDVWVLPVRTRTIPPATHTNVWMPGAGRFAIVDPGSDRPEEIERLLRLVDKRRGSGARPEAVLLTHSHPDHVAGVEAIAGALGLPVMAHPVALERLGLPAGLEQRAVEDGDRLDLDGMVLIAHHTPGHAPDHIAYEVEGRRALIAGDLHSGLSTILVHPPEGHMATYLETLARTHARGFRQLLPAHGPPLPGKVLAKVIDHRNEREAKILALVGDGWRSLADLTRAAYDDVPGMPAFLTEGQALGHLEHLEEQGKVRRREAGAGVNSEWMRA